MAGSSNAFRKNRLAAAASRLALLVVQPQSPVLGSEAMRQRLADNPEPKSVIYSFEYTAMWDHARQYAGWLALDGGSAPDMVVLDRLAALQSKFRSR